MSGLVEEVTSGGQATPYAKKTFNGPCFVKLLVNNILAGSIIGKGGSVIGQIEHETGSCLKLSPANCYFPLTQDRIVVVSGKQEQINNAILIILDKLKDSPALQGVAAAAAAAAQYGGAADPYGMGGVTGVEGGAQRPSMQLRMVVPKSCVSAVIGKGGAQIKQMQEATGARIQISNREEGLNERILTISGNFAALQRAALSVAATIQADPNLKDHLYVVYTPAASSGFMAAGGGYGGQYGQPSPYGAQGYSSFASPYYSQGGAGPSSYGGGRGGGGSHSYRGSSSGSAAGGGTSVNGMSASISGGGSGGGMGGVSGSSAYAYGASPYMSAGGAAVMHAGGGMGGGSQMPSGNPSDLMNQNCEIVMQIADACVGPLIGKNGACLGDIIYSSGAKVRISPKGELVEGTQDRQCRIRGSLASVHTAHIMLLQRLEAVEEQRRQMEAGMGDISEA
eukprot:GHVQ01033959.1.p1 GENE.GHVQ01033959.1~~GHVQ01033959.1.p1  ORF type:complete len:452 (+),score=81.89 GHVQ01033959.1:720-2075(+)